MNPLKKPLHMALVALASLQLSGCSRTVEWEEEVLLNTGETITVHKEVRYSIKGQPGNPADLGYLPDFVESTSFKYGGRDYSYRGDANIMVLAISDKKLPVLLAPASSNGWYRRNDYKCVHPYYVQLVPDSSGQQWTWPDKIEPWTYNLPANLMIDRAPPSDVKRRYTMADKSKQTYLQDPQLIDIQKINPFFIDDQCKGSN